MKGKMFFQSVVITFFVLMNSFSLIAMEKPLSLNSKRELFVDFYLIDQLDNTQLVLHEPRDEGPVLYFEKPWEGIMSAYVTVIKDGPLYRLYYRGCT